MYTFPLINVPMAMAHMNECLAQGRLIEAAALRKRIVQFNQDYTAFMAKLERED